MNACMGGLVYYCFGYAISYGGPNDGSGSPFAGGRLYESDGDMVGTKGPTAKDGLTTAWFGSDTGMDTGGWFYAGANLWMLVDVGVEEYYFFFLQYVFAATIATIVSLAPSPRGFSSAAASSTRSSSPDHSPRIGRFVDGKPVELAQHNVPMMCLGLFILWLGFIPFIGGFAGFVNFQLGRLVVKECLE